MPALQESSANEGSAQLSTFQWPASLKRRSSSSSSLSHSNQAVIRHPFGKFQALLQEKEFRAYRSARRASKSVFWALVTRLGVQALQSG